jgi:hypothetical protein
MKPTFSRRGLRRFTTLFTSLELDFGISKRVSVDLCVHFSTSESSSQSVFRIINNLLYKSVSRVADCSLAPFSETIKLANFTVLSSQYPKNMSVLAGKIYRVASLRLEKAPLFCHLSPFSPAPRCKLRGYFYKAAFGGCFPASLREK